MNTQSYEHMSQFVDNTVYTVYLIAINGHKVVK